jgi:hypothetical protein
LANTITDIVPKLIGMMLPKLRANSIMPRLVNRDFDSLAAQQGSTINVPLPPTIATNAVTAAATPPSTADTVLSTAPVALDQWVEAPFYMTDKDMLEVVNGAIPACAESAMSALVDTIDAFILTKLSQGAGAATGTAGTSPFATTALALTPGKLLNDHRVSRQNRHVVMDAAAELNLLSLEAFSNSQFTGDVTAMIDGAFQGNRRVGSQWWLDQNVASHVKGTGASYQLAAAVAVGDTTITVDTGSGTILPGDVITFAADTVNKYVVATALSGGSLTINAPGIKVAVADNNVITVTANHVANVAFARESMVFASRPFQASSAAIASRVMADPISGLSLRLEVNREHKRDRWSLDALYGGSVVRPEGVIKILG